MKKILIFSFIIICLFGARNVFASTCNTIGNTTFCDDGTTYNTIGNTTFGSDGSTYNTIGNTTFVNGPNGYSGTANTIGNTTFYNGSGGDNWTANSIGNTTFINGSNGTNGTINTIGNTSFGSGNVFYTCPTNSHTSYIDSSKCTCDTGYVISGSSCVYDYSVPTTPTCPLNSYYDGVSSCKCNYGYSISGDSCIAITQVCQNKYGYNSYGSGTSCYCSIGYQWNTTQTACIATQTTPTCPINSYESGTYCKCNYGYQNNLTNDGCVLIPVVTAPIKTNNQACQDAYGFNSNWDGTKTADDQLNCACQYGYLWNEQKTSCVIQPTNDNQDQTIIIPSIPVSEASPATNQIVSTSTDKVEQEGFWAKLLKWFGF